MSSINFRHLPLRVTLPLLIFCVMLAGLGVSLYLTDRQYREELIERTRSDALQEVARLVRRAESDAARQNAGVEREIMLYATARHNAAYVAQVDPDGEVVFATHVVWKGQSAARALPEWDAARFDSVTRGAGLDMRWDGSRRKLSVLMPYLHAPGPGQATGIRRGAIILEYDLSDALLQATQRNLLLRIPSVAIVVLLVMMMAYWLHRRLALPMTRLSKAAQRIGQGDLATPVEIGGVGEVADVASSLNQMARKIAGDQVALAEAREVLERRLQRAHEENVMISRLLTDATVGRGDFRAFSWAATELLSRHFEVARVNIWRFGEEDALLYCVDHFDAVTRSHTHGAILQAADYVSEFAALEDAAYIDGSDPFNNPLLENYARAHLQPQGVTSLLKVVLRLGPRLIGICCLEHVGRPHVWQPDEIRFACQIGTLLSSVADEEERRKTQAAVATQNEALQMMAAGRPLPEVLNTLSRALELQFPGMLASVLLMDAEGGNLHHAACPSLPPDYWRAVDGIRVGERAASFGTAAWHRRQVIVEDIAHDPLWADYRDLALEHGLQACWSTPVMDAEGQVLGVIAVYYSSPMRPSPQQLNLMESSAQTAAIAIQHDHTESRLRKLSQAVEQSPESIYITDLAGRIEYVNAAFTRNTGYSREEVLGNTPRLRSSGKTQAAVYQRMRAALRHGQVWHGEFINLRKDGAERIEQTTIGPIRDSSGVTTHYLAVQQDVTEERQAAQMVNQLAYFDALTGLPNRVQLLDCVGVMQKGDTGDLHALILIDLDRFKNINNARGHALGDEILKTLAGRLNGMLGEGDLAARLSADEFAVLLRGVEAAPGQVPQAMTAAEAIQRSLHQPAHLLGDEIAVTTSLGVALFKTGADPDPVEVLRRADTALHRAKDAGGNQIVLFDESMEQAMQQRFQIESDLRQAIPAGELRLYLQPQVDAVGTLAGAEALVRWQHPQRGLVPPGMFIAVAEESDLIVELDRWVFGAVCRLMAAHDMDARPLRFSVNISPRHFRKPGFVGWVRQTMADTGADPTRLTLEVTEGLVIDNVSEVIGKMSELSALGIHFSIDDFGTGYSSLAYLKRLPIHELKIDKTFVQDAPTDPDDAALIEVILAVASHLHLKVVAEGVETREQVDFLNRRGQVIHQGYFFGRPEPAESFSGFCGEEKK